MILHSNILGKGEPLLILHGYFGMGDNWKSLGKKFSQNFEVHLIDQRNHGRSFHSDDFSYELMVDDLYKYIIQHNLNDITLLGHSMGGKTAMLFATSYQELVRKLIIADISPKYYAPHHQFILKALCAVDFSTITKRREVETIFTNYIEEIGIRQFLLKNVFWVNKEQLAYRFNLQSLKENNEEIGMSLPSFSIFDKETLFLKGSKSNYIKSEDISLIEAHFPKATIQTIKNAGHWLHAENPVDFYDSVMAFIN